MQRGPLDYSVVILNKMWEKIDRVEIQQEQNKGNN